MAKTALVNRVAVWGRGPAASSLVREGEATDAAVATAARFGFHLHDPDAWAVEVEASDEEVDAATRHDAAVLGWAPLLVRPAPEAVVLAHQALDAIGRRVRVAYPVADRTLHATTVVVGVELRQGETGRYRLRLLTWDEGTDPRARTYIDDPSTIEIVDE